MSALDWLVLLSTILGIAVYGMWRARGKHSTETYLKGSGDTGWFVIGLSVMATQASAVTFLSTPGQGFQGGLGFVQMYFGMPIALIIIAAFFLPIFRKLKVITAYEYLGRRFDSKTRLLGAAVFLLQRAMGAGLTIYAPAIVLSKVLGWPLDATILCSGIVVIVYTTSGGSDAVNQTQKYQIGVIFAGMIAAFVILLRKIPSDLSFTDSLAIAGGLDKLNAVDFSFDFGKRYTLWSGLIAATFHMLAYFGTDQSQVQRYLSGASLRESRLGLMFNAVCKIPMQFFILSLGVLLFVFYQFEKPPVYFDQVAWQQFSAGEHRDAAKQFEGEFASAHLNREQKVRAWIEARHSGNAALENEARAAATQAHEQIESVRRAAKLAVDPKGHRNDLDYIFVTFILNQFPHGVIGLLIASFFAAALSAKAAELNALGSATTVDFYRHVIRRNETDSHYLIASKWFTVFWGAVSILFAFCLTLAENLVQAVNIVGAIFYPVMLSLFVVGFFFRRIGGTAVFWGALTAQVLVLILFFTVPDARLSYLWYNPIGCAVCLMVSSVVQLTFRTNSQPGNSTPRA